MTNPNMIEELTSLFQNFIAPQLEGMKGELKAVNARIDAMGTNIESFRRELLAEIRRVEDTLSADFVRLESKVDLRLASMDERTDLRLASMDERVDMRLASVDQKLDLLRRELLAEIKASSNR